ncbi:hypothetical protein [Klebsiella phage vB_KpnS-VAC35]|uniref:Uncharacterized protein n=1 Tax=Klebsiella phage vB_KpnS-VAC35 TaxID=2866696 RepID=A0AAE8YE69_9CAUD|nr:hypothetical protein [Klebsiella phage vB_KpnS-VAC35]
MKYDSLNNPSTNYLTDQSVSEIKFMPNATRTGLHGLQAGISFRFRNLRFTFVGEEAKMISIIDKVKAVSELSGSDTVKFEALTSLLLTSGATVEKFELIQPHVSALTNSRNIWDQANVESLIKWDSATEFYNK